MCVPPVRVCVCVYVRRPCATAARGTHRPPRGGTGTGTCPGSRGGGGGRQPDAGDRETKRGSSVRASAGRADRVEKRERSPVHGAQPGAGAGNRRAEPGGRRGSGEGQFSGVTGTQVPTGGFRGIREGGSRGTSLVWEGESQVGRPGSERQVPGSGKGSSPVWGSAPGNGDSPGGVSAPKVAWFG